MILWQNRILTNIKVILGDKVARVTSTPNGDIAKFPTCSVQTVSNNQTASDMSYHYLDNAVYCAVSINMFTNTSLDDCYELMQIADRGMQAMGFIRDMGAFQVETESSKIYRLNARYSRRIGNAEEIVDFRKFPLLNIIKYRK